MYVMVESILRIGIYYIYIYTRALDGHLHNGFGYWTHDLLIRAGEPVTIVTVRRQKR